MLQFVALSQMMQFPVDVAFVLVLFQAVLAGETEHETILVQNLDEISSCRKTLKSYSS